MAASKTIVASPRRAADGGAWASVLLIGDAAYPGAAGYPIFASDFGLAEIDHVVVALAFSASFFLIAMWDPATGAIRFFYPTGSSLAQPVAVGQPYSGIPAGAVAVTSSSAQPILPFVAGSGVEVGGGTNLSAFSVRLIAFGRAR